MRIARLAQCSVVVAPSDIIPEGSGVVVGIDGSVESDLAVTFAAEFADRVGEPLTVVLAWGHPEPWGMTEPLIFVEEPSEEDRLLIAESVTGLAVRFPDLTVHTQVSGARAERALYGAALGSRLLVVGSRGRNGLLKTIMGSTSEAMVSDLPCAVAVVRDQPSLAGVGCAVQAAHRVDGVTAVANDLSVRLPFRSTRSDQEIAAAVRDAISLCGQVVFIDGGSDAVIRGDSIW